METRDDAEVSDILEDSDKELTLHICGQKCDHDWSEREKLVDDGWVYGESLRCSKCKALAVDQDIWG